MISCFHLLYPLFSQYQWSKISTIGVQNLDTYLEILGKSRCEIMEDDQFTRLYWSDNNSQYLIRFLKNGNFDMIEREIWFEYSFLTLRKKIILDIHYPHSD